MEPGWTSGKRQVNGLSLHVVEVGPADGPLFVLLHGFPEFWWAWRHQITPLAERGYRVVVPDMRGYDLSDAPHPDLWAKQALKHPIQALRSTYVALFQLPWPPWLPEAALGALDFAGLRAMVEGSARADAFKPGEMERYAEAWAHPGSLTAMLNYYRALRDRRAANPPARIAPPTLVLWGERDSFLEHSVARAALKLCGDGRLVIAEGATHWLHLEEPARVNAEIISFLGGPG